MILFLLMDTDVSIVASSQSGPANIMTQAVKKEGKIVYAYQQAAIHDGMLSHRKLSMMGEVPWQDFVTHVGRVT